MELKSIELHYCAVRVEHKRFTMQSFMIAIQTPTLSRARTYGSSESTLPRVGCFALFSPLMRAGWSFEIKKANGSGITATCNVHACGATTASELCFVIHVHKSSKSSMIWNLFLPAKRNRCFHSQPLKSGSDIASKLRPKLGLLSRRISLLFDKITTQNTPATYPEFGFDII